MKVFGCKTRQKKDSSIKLLHAAKSSSLSYIKILAILLCFISFPLKITHAQDSFSLQVNGGIIYPIGSQRGFSSSLQLNYRVNSSLSFYIYSGYSGWDRNKVTFRDEGKISSAGYGPRNFNSYSEDSHILIPVYIGTTLNFNAGKLLTPFISMETGYSYLSYYSYEQTRIVSSENGFAVNYLPDLSSKKLNIENLFGVGIGGGFTLPLSGTINLLLAFKINSFVNSHYYGLFSTRGTYTALTAGINFGL